MRRKQSDIIELTPTPPFLFLFFPATCPAPPARRLISYNVTFANYVNYQTGLQLSWTDYAAAANATSCNLGNYTGNSDSTQTVICASALPLTDTTGILEIDSPCARAATMATAIGQSLYQQRQKLALSYFDSAYSSRCLSAASLEQFKIQYTTSEYHYTLYYYDLAGNLVKTVPPKGTRPNFSAAFIKSVDSSRAIGAVDTPQHVFSTRYCYNSLNSVIAQRTPDAGVSQFWYDRLGRLVVSQNAQQSHDGNYSYTVYDALSRITEVGQTPQGTAMTQTVSQDSAGFAAWMNATTSNRTQITATVYDQPAWNMAGLMTQQNLRNRLSYTYTKNNATDGNFYTASYYTYDVHGNVDTLIQDYLYVPGMSTTPYKRICYDYDLVSGKVNGVDYQPGASDAFYYRYQYDAENRLTNVLTSRDSITWEQDASYLYYKHGPLSRTVLGQLQTQGIDYTYTLQGWLKGVNIGNGYGAAIVDSSGSFCAAGSALSDVVVTSRSVTDTPYTYTARSSVTFDSGFETYDGDSLQTNINDSLTACNLPASGGDTASASGLSEAYPVAQDAYSFSLHYYPGDYNAVGATTPVTDVLTILGSQASPLYNGNIAASAVVLPGGLRPQVYSYQYDQLNRLVQMKVDTGLNAATHTFTPVQLPDYGERVAYDPNGNINGYVRHGYGANIPMDSLTYHYYANTNQLQRINDSAGGSYTTDLKDQGTGSNYTYDLNGQLKKDATNGVSAIDWTVYGKIDTVVNGSGTIAYTYDAAGNRITKTVSDTNTIYVRDAQGNILAIYTQSGSGAPAQTEVDLYGSSRLGSVRALTVAPTSVSLGGGYGTAYLSTFSRGEKSYELTNHLGNVLSTITDKKIAVSSTTDSSLIDHFMPDVATTQDYYPFGMQMPGRTFTAATSSNYRYGFNGKENDNEVKGIGNEQDYGARIYDPRIGRFLSIDPLMQKFPELTPYQFASNTPIQGTDLDGMEVDFSNAKIPKQKYVPGIPTIFQIETFKNNVAAATYNSIIQDAEDLSNVAVSSKGRSQVAAKYGAGLMKAIEFSSKPIDQQYASLKRYFSNVDNVEDFAGALAGGAIEGFGASFVIQESAALIAKGVSIMQIYEGNTIIENALKSGARLRFVEGDEVRLMQAMGKEAGIRWLGNGVAEIQLPNDASRSMIMEEAIHYQQYTKYGEEYMHSNLGRLKSEIEAQDILLKIGKKEKWSDTEMNKINQAKATWEKALSKEEQKH